MPKPLLLFVYPISIKIAGCSETEQVLAFCTWSTKTTHSNTFFSFISHSHWCSTPSEKPKHPVLLRKFHKYPLQENSVSDINTSIWPPCVLPCVDQMIRNHSFAYNCITQFPLCYQNVILWHVDQMFPPSSLQVTLNTCLLQSCWNPCIQSYLSHGHNFRMIHLIKILQHNSIGSKHKAQAAE